MKAMDITNAPRKTEGPSTLSDDLDCVNAVEGDTVKREPWSGNRITGAKYANRTRMKDVKERRGAR